MDGIGEFIGRYVLQQVADGASLQRPLDQFLFLEAGQGDDLDLGTHFPEGAGGSGAVHLRHHKVHQYNVRSHLFAQTQRLLTVVCFSYEMQAWSDPKDSRQSPPHHAVVVHDHHSDCIMPAHRPGFLSR